MIALEYHTYNILGQSISDQYSLQIPWNVIWKNTFLSCTWPENNNALYILLHYATRTNDHLLRWTNQKYRKTPKCKFCKNTENIKHLFIDCKRNQKIWIHFQKYLQKIPQRDYRPLQHILSVSAISLPPNSKKLFLTLTIRYQSHFQTHMSTNCITV